MTMVAYVAGLITVMFLAILGLTWLWKKLYLEELRAEYAHRDEINARLRGEA